MSARRKKGMVHVELLENGSTRLRYTFKKKRYSEVVDSTQSEIRKTEIELEIKKGIHVPAKLKETSRNLSLTEAWEKFLKFKKKTSQEKTWVSTYKPINSWVQKCPYKTLDEAPKAIRWYEERCTSGTTRRVLMRLSACCREFCDRNPFDGEYKRFREKYQDDPEPRMLTDEEIEAGLSKLSSVHQGFVRFMLLTGCRPGEALGLHCEDIQSDVIRFHQQRLDIEGKEIIKEGLKTQKERYFPLNRDAKEFMKRFSEDGLIFASVRLNNFSQRQWKKAFPSDTTPYNCRDTFITQQLIKGVSSDVVAAWVGNSAAVINKHYLDKVKLGLSQLPK